MEYTRAMKTRLLGGGEVPVIGQGTWNMELDDKQAAIAALRRGLDLGMTHIDTAEMYGSGRVERLVGKAISGRRDEVYLASKVLPFNASTNETIRACERSLKRLRTGHLDLYLLHWPASTPREETIAGFERLVADGKILAYGMSNFDVENMEEAVSIAGAGKVACNQLCYHLGQRAIEQRVGPWCARHGVSVVAYSPLGSGDFPAPHTPGGAVLTEVATKHGATARQIALTFLVREEHTMAIPKASRAEHVRENMGASELKLDVEDLARIDAAFPCPASPASLPVI